MNEPELTELLFRHVEARRYFDATRSRILRIPQTLAIQNRNLSSQTAMAFRRPSITREELSRAFVDIARSTPPIRCRPSSVWRARAWRGWPS